MHDGSFSPGVSLRRLLARCPSLRSDRKLSSLERECDSGEDLVEALAEPFLHPMYTIPIVGCFRPLCQKIAERAVEKLKEKKIDKGTKSTRLYSENDTSIIGDEIGEETSVVDFYGCRGRGLTLRLHEIAALALCRALDLAPFLLKCVLTYFDFSPPPFERVICMGASLPASIKEINLLLGATQLSYRFLAMEVEPKEFSERWDWSCFLDLLQSLGDLNLTGTTRSPEELEIRRCAVELKWCTVQILSIVLKSSDRIVENVGLQIDEAFECYERWKKFCSDISLEKAALYFEGDEQDSSDNIGCITSSSPVVESQDSQIVHSSESKDSKPDPPFQLTTSMKETFKMAEMAVRQKWPVLLYGPVGAGKTALISKLATGKRVLSIHMDEQMDSRTLIGGYVCAEKPGDFKWNPGSLTQAIVKGYWIVFEDIDKAPSDVQSVLLPLMEGATSFSTGHGEVIEVADNFRLFATVTTSGTDIEGRSFSALWRQLLVRPPGREDMLAIIEACYPCLKPISSILLDIFEKINKMMSVQLVGSVSPGSSSRFSLRDLLKWCKRLMCDGVDNFDDYEETIFLEATDIFAANLSSLDKRLSVLRGVLPVSTNKSKLTIQVQEKEFQIGRVKLECIKKPVMEKRRSFVDLTSSLQTLERIACSVKHNEPVLLVGETGTGKTTLVQNLAAWLGQSLTVIVCMPILFYC